MRLYVVAWCSVWNTSAGIHGDAGTLMHLTEASTLAGSTLCGKSFPADKGHAGGVTRYCKRCLKKAYAAGEPQGFTRSLQFVRSEEA